MLKSLQSLFHQTEIIVNRVSIRFGHSQKNLKHNGKSVFFLIKLTKCKQNFEVISILNVILIHF